MIITDQNFSESVANGKVLVKFWTPNCPACKLISPAVEDIAKRFPIQVLSAQDTDCLETGQRLGLDKVPTLVFFEDGQEQGRLVGYQQSQAIEGLVNGNYSCS